jgi:hypothetical protein
MAKEIIDLSKVAYNKNQYTKVIDTLFTQLVSIPITASISVPSQINGFFEQYQNLFFEIPKFGQTNSHEYLVKTSGEYIGEIKTDDTVNALLEEITQLRQENLDLQQQLFQISQNTTNTQ